MIRSGGAGSIGLDDRHIDSTGRAGPTARDPDGAGRSLHADPAAGVDPDLGPPAVLDEDLAILAAAAASEGRGHQRDRREDEASVQTIGDKPLRP